MNPNIRCQEGVGSSKEVAKPFSPRSNSEPQMIKERNPRHVKVKRVQKCNNALGEMKNKEKLRTSLLF